VSTDIKSSPERDKTSATGRTTIDHKVVIRLGSGEVIKGYFTVHVEASLEAILDNSISSDSQSIMVKTAQTNESISVAWSEVKSIFFVKSFRGDPTRKGLRFYAKGPAVGEILAEIRFNDNEVIEGTIDNSAKHIVGVGVLLYPSDPNSNNLMVYANKSAIANYRVLGVRGYRGPEAEIAKT
jgi:hypothetical protein